ncbi:hypothetical protein [Streptomyces sp. NPDC088762]|uniref:hypothetical protein n=1 Tax=Streptomyces sp. NPDC088762 TaxID=3365891 RepID=UPI00382A1A23
MPDSEKRLRKQVVKLKELRAKDAEELTQIRPDGEGLVRTLNQLGSSHLAGVYPTIAGWPAEGSGHQAGGMTQRAQEQEPGACGRPPAEAGGRGDARRRRSALWEFFGMALAASGLCVAVVSPDLRDAVVHTLAAKAVELTR